MGPEKNHVVAWQGFEALVPIHWDMDVVSGDDRNGYFQLSDGIKCSLEVRWNYSRKHPGLDKVLERYSKLLQKGRRRLSPGAQLEKKAEIVAGTEDERAGFVVQTEGSGRLYGFGGYSERSRRIILAQVAGVPLNQVRYILSNLRDRSGESGWNHWAIYELDISLPEGFTLKNRRLVAGYVYLHFSRKNLEYAVERWGPASEILKGRTLEDFIVESRASEGTRIRETSAIDCPHAGLHHLGSRPLRWQKSPKGLSRFWKTWECRMWVCNESNRVFAEHFFYPRKNRDWVDEVGLLCHTTPG